MLKRTHIAVGIASSLAIIAPQTYTSILATTVAGAIGSQIPDIDSATSGSHKDANLICLSSLIFIGGAAICDKQINLGLMSRILNNTGFAQLLLGTLLLISLCAYGKETHHRTFMHSLLACFLSSIAVWIAIPFAAPGFMVGFLSHIGIDLLNKRKVQVFFPLKKGLGFKLCKSDGYVNHALCIIGSILSLLLLIYLCIRH